VQLYLHPQYAFMAWYSVQAQGQLYLFKLLCHYFDKTFNSIAFTFSLHYIISISTSDLGVTVFTQDSRLCYQSYRTRGIVGSISVEDHEGFLKLHSKSRLCDGTYNKTKPDLT
jgi:hypothetical protein